MRARLLRLTLSAPPRLGGSDQRLDVARAENQHREQLRRVDLAAEREARAEQEQDGEGELHDQDEHGEARRAAVRICARAALRCSRKASSS